MAQSKNQPMLSIDRFFTGLYTRRNPLFTPFRSVGINVVQFHDALIDGLNVELSDNYTLQRRPGFPVYCSQAFGLLEHVQAFSSVRNLAGTVYSLAETNLALYTFTTSALTSIVAKTTTAQGFTQQVGNKTYYANGVDFKKWDGTNTTSFGSAAAINPPVMTLPTTSSSAEATFWQPNTPYTVGCILLDTNGNFQLQVTAGGPPSTGFTPPLWNTQLNGLTNDGSLQWQNCGTYTLAWQASTPYSVAFVLLDLNGNLQQVTAAGTSGATVPVWNTTPGGTTTDGGVTWTNRGPGLALAQFGYSWCYAYRTIYGHLTTASPVTASTLPVIGPLVGAGPSHRFVLTGLGTDFGFLFNAAYTASQVAIKNNILTITVGNNFVPGLSIGLASFVGASFLNGNTVQILSASATQFTAYFKHADYGPTADPSGVCSFESIEIYRIADGGAIFYYAGALTNPGASSTWTFTDLVSDAQLNTQFIAPLFHLNDPPPGSPGSTIATGGTIMCWWQGRIWMASGNNLFFDAGPDCLNGIPEEAWPPANVFGYPGAVSGLSPTSQGLVVWLSDRAHVVLGGPQTLSFYSQPLLQNFGISSPNCVSQDGDQLYLLTTSQQYFSLSANGKSEDGWRVGDLLQTNFPAASSYVAMHRAGEDTGVFLSNNAALGSVETSPGVYTLVVGPTGTTSPRKILARNLTTFSDGAAISSCSILRYGLNTSAWSPLYQTAAGAYPAFATIGSITLSLPGGPPVPLASVLTNFVNVGTRPVLSILWNEISANSVRGFIDIPKAAAIDLLQSEHVNTSQSMLYLKWPTNANLKKEPTLAHNVQIKIDFGSSDTVKNELLYLGLDD
jgi:hypothetical protein